MRERSTARIALFACASLGNIILPFFTSTIAGISTAFITVPLAVVFGVGLGRALTDMPSRPAETSHPSS